MFKFVQLQIFFVKVVCSFVTVCDRIVCMLQ